MKYQEKQSLKNSKLIPVIIGIVFLCMLPTFYFTPLLGLGMFALIAGMVYMLLVFLTQDIGVDEHGFHYKMSIFHNSHKSILWSEVESMKRIEFSALKDFGGYGIRKTFKRTGYIISDGQGIELSLKTKKVIVFGSDDIDQLSKAINKYFEENLV